jgi:preprotein translocase subunit SecE
MAEKPPKAPKAPKEQKQPKEKKKRVGPLTFISQVRAEGNKVTWTTRQETIQATIFVLIMSILFGIFLFFVDTLITLFVNFVRGA